MSYKRDGNFIYQTILISPSKRSHTRYYTFDKYEIGRKVSDFLDKIYIGDGETVFFREKKKFRNQYTLKYEVDGDIELDLSEKKYHITGEVPRHDGCEFCEHLSRSKRGKDRCLFYKTFLERHKVYCVDFHEKET